MHLDRCSPLWAVNAFYCKFARTIRLPTNPIGRRQTSATCLYSNTVGHNKCRIKTYAKLTNQSGIFLLIARKLREKFFRTRASNSAQVSNGFIAAHANAVVSNSHGPGSLIKTDVDLQIRIITIPIGMLDPLKAELV